MNTTTQGQVFPREARTPRLGRAGGAGRVARPVRGGGLQLRHLRHHHHLQGGLQERQVPAWLLMCAVLETRHPVAARSSQTSCWSDKICGTLTKTTRNCCSGSGEKYLLDGRITFLHCTLLPGTRVCPVSTQWSPSTTSRSEHLSSIIIQSFIQP